jgi:hypothetical protein
LKARFLDAGDGCSIIHNAKTTNDICFKVCAKSSDTGSIKEQRCLVPPERHDVDGEKNRFLKHITAPGKYQGETTDAGEERESDKRNIGLWPS